MSFEDKKIKVSRFVVDGGWTGNDRNDALTNAQNRVASKLDSVTDEVDVGWASGRAELNLELTPGECFVGEYLYLSMRIAVRRVPSGMAKALLRKKTEEYIRLNNAEYVSSKAKKELKQEVQEYLLPRTMPTVKSVWVVICPDGVVYAGTASRAERDMLCVIFAKTFGKQIVAQDFYHAMEAHPNGKSFDFEFPELEFLTDLFRQSDSDEASNFCVHPPYDFISPDSESPCTRSLAVGCAAATSAEVRTALNQSKLLKKAKIGVAAIPPYADGDWWCFVMNRDGALTGLQTPDGEEMEFVARFAEKIDMLNTLFGWIKEKIDDFIARASTQEYNTVRAKWLADR